MFLKAQGQQSSSSEKQAATPFIKNTPHDPQASSDTGMLSTRIRRNPLYFIKRHLWGLVFGICLTGFTTYLLLDTFAITRVYAVVDASNSSAGQNNSASSGGTFSTGSGSSSSSSSSADSSSSSNSSSSTDSSSSSDSSSSTDSSSSGSSASIGTVTQTDTIYSDDNISISLSEYREYDTSIYVADITVSSPEYLKTALAKSVYGKNVTEKTSSMAEDNNAILAINGDYYGAQESGYVIRNGTLYRSAARSGQEDLVIYADGSFEIIEEDEITAEELLENGAQQVLSFGPALVTDSEVSVDENTEVGKAMASNPRTAIGIIDENHYVFVVSDGRTSESEGLSLYELAEFMQSLGVTTAYNLDGGGSSTMYFNGSVVNNPTTSGKTISERSVSDIVYIGY